MIDESRSGRSRARERLTPQNSAVLLVDHQSGLDSGVRDLEPDEVSHNVVAFARVARLPRAPAVLTSSAPEIWSLALPPATSSRSRRLQG
jgi:nicotinamidase-related amidase